MLKRIKNKLKRMELLKRKEKNRLASMLVIAFLILLGVMSFIPYIQSFSPNGDGIYDIIITDDFTDSGWNVTNDMVHNLSTGYLRVISNYGDGFKYGFAWNYPLYHSIYAIQNISITINYTMEIDQGAPGTVGTNFLKAHMRLLNESNSSFTDFDYVDKSNIDGNFNETYYFNNLYDAENRQYRWVNISFEANANGTTDNIAYVSINWIKVQIDADITYENFSTWTEVDNANDTISVLDDYNVNVNVTRGDYTYLYEDKGNFSDFNGSFSFVCNALKDTSFPLAGLLILYNVSGDIKDAGDNKSIQIRLYGNNLKLMHYNSSSGSTDYVQHIISVGHKYYIDFEKSGNTVTLDCYNDSLKTDLYFTLSLYLYQPASSYRYVETAVGTQLSNPDASPIWVNATVSGIYFNHIPLLNITNIIDVTSAYNATERGFHMGSSAIYYNNMSFIHPGRHYNDDPDWIIWVNESSGTGGQYEVEDSGTTSTHGGGSVVFANNGTLWYIRGGYFNYIAADLFMSNSPFSYNSWTKKLDNFITVSGGCAPVLGITQNQSLLVFYRNGPNDAASTGTQLLRYSIPNATQNKDVTLARGETWEGHALCPTYIWSRTDPRYNYTFVTWAWKEEAGTYDNWGSAPFIYTDDNGNTWKRANGTAYTLPIRYSSIDGWQSKADIPDDNIANNLYPYNYGAEAGMTPDGYPYMITLHQDVRDGPGYGYFWLWNGTAWESHNLTNILEYQNAMTSGVTKDYVFFAYTEADDNKTIKVKISGDNGQTWSNPITIINESSAGNIAIDGISYCQPIVNYTDNVVRLFYSFYNWSATDNQQNKVKWVKFDISDILNDTNMQPTCSLSASPTSGNVPLTVTFSMSASDSDGSIVSWSLDIDNDGSAEYSGSGGPPATQIHTYNNYGTYTARLIVTDNNGSSAYDTATITVTGFTDNGTAESMTFPDTDINATGWVIANGNYLVITNNNYTVDGSTKWVMTLVPTLLNGTLLEYLIPPGNVTGWKCYAKIPEDDDIWHEIPSSNAVNGWFYINDSIWNYSFDVGDHMYIRWAFNASVTPDYAGVYSGWSAWNISDISGYASNQEYNLTVTLTGAQPPNVYPPIKPLSPTPSNGTYISVGQYPLMQCLVYDPDSTYLSVSFYWGNGTLIGVDSSVEGNWGIASIEFPDVIVGNTYTWYAIADDGTYTNRSANWTFTVTGGDSPVLFSPYPENNSINVSVPPELSINVYDSDSSSVTLTYYDYSTNTTLGVDHITFSTQEAYYSSIVMQNWYTGTTYKWYVKAIDSEGNEVRYPSGNYSYLKFTTVSLSNPAIVFYLRNASNINDKLYNVSIECIETNTTVYSDLVGTAVLTFSVSDLGNTYHVIFKHNDYKTKSETYEIMPGTSTYVIKLNPKYTGGTNMTSDVWYQLANQYSSGMKMLIAFIVIAVFSIMSLYMGGEKLGITVALLGATVFTMIGFLPWWILFIVGIVVAFMMMKMMNMSLPFGGGGNE